MNAEIWKTKRKLDAVKKNRKECSECIVRHSDRCSSESEVSMEIPVWPLHEQIFKERTYTYLRAYADVHNGRNLRYEAFACVICSPPFGKCQAECRTHRRDKSASRDAWDIHMHVSSAIQSW